MQLTQRWQSLDALRGLTIAGMILVNNPGQWEPCWPILKHAEWAGLSLADLVFPFFLFIVGVSIDLATTRQLHKGVAAGSLLTKGGIRAAKLFGIGLAIGLTCCGAAHK